MFSRIKKHYNNFYWTDLEKDIKQTQLTIERINKNLDNLEKKIDQKFDKFEKMLEINCNGIKKIHKDIEEL